MGLIRQSFQVYKKIWRSNLPFWHFARSYNVKKETVLERTKNVYKAITPQTYSSLMSSAVTVNVTILVHDQLQVMCSVCEEMNWHTSLTCLQLGLAVTETPSILFPWKTRENLANNITSRERQSLWSSHGVPTLRSGMQSRTLPTLSSYLLRSFQIRGVNSEWKNTANIYYNVY